VKFINGNGKAYTRGLPKIVIIGEVNKVALSFLEKNTGLNFTKTPLDSRTTRPTRAEQIVKLFMTYNWKTRYYDNAMYNNTLFIKSRPVEEWD